MRGSPQASELTLSLRLLWKKQRKVYAVFKGHDISGFKPFRGRAWL
jgi:hypothetical protein